MDLAEVRNSKRFQLLMYCTEKGFRESGLRWAKYHTLNNTKPAEIEKDAGRILDGLKKGTITPEEILK